MAKDTSSGQVDHNSGDVSSNQGMIYVMPALTFPFMQIYCVTDVTDLLNCETLHLLVRNVWI